MKRKTDEIVVVELQSMTEGSRAILQRSITAGWTYDVCEFAYDPTMGDGRYVVIPVELQAIWNPLRKANDLLKKFRLFATPLIDTQLKRLILVICPAVHVALTDEDFEAALAECSKRLGDYAGEMAQIVSQKSLPLPSISTLSSDPESTVPNTIQSGEDAADVRTDQGGLAELSPKEDDLMDEPNPEGRSPTSAAMTTTNDPINSDVGVVDESRSQPPFRAKFHELFGTVTKWNPEARTFAILGASLRGEKIHYEADQAQSVFVEVFRGDGKVNARVKETLSPDGVRLRLFEVRATERLPIYETVCPFCGS